MLVLVAVEPDFENVKEKCHNCQRKRHTFCPAVGRTVIIAMVMVTWLETVSVTKFNVAHKYFWSFGLRLVLPWVPYLRLVLPLIFLIVSKFNVTQPWQPSNQHGHRDRCQQKLKRPLTFPCATIGKSWRQERSGGKFTTRFTTTFHPGVSRR